MVLNSKLFVLHETLHLINLKLLISNITVGFSKFSPKFTQKDIFIILDETLKFHKFQIGDFKYDNRFLNLSPENTQIRHLKFAGVDSKYKKPKIPNNPNQKNPNKVFLVPEDASLFCYQSNRALDQSERRLFLKSKSATLLESIPSRF